MKSYGEAEREETCFWKTLATSLHFQFMETRERNRFGPCCNDGNMFLPSVVFFALDQTEIFYPPMAANTVALSRTFQVDHTGDKLAQ